MNIQEYIASGILESYIIGEVSAEEAAQVEKMAADHPEVKAELDKIELALEQYAVLLGTTPPAGTLTEVLEQLPDASGGSSKGFSNRGGFWSIAVLAVLTSVLAFYFYRAQQSTSNQLNQTQNDLQTLQEDCTEKDDQLREQANIIALLMDPNTRSATMQGTDLAPQAIAQVFVNENNRQVYLNTGTLPEPPADKSYQLWGLVDGNPVDMGIFELILDGGLQAVPFVDGAQTYAVTLEDKGGKPTPDLTQLYVIGNVG